MNCIGDNKSTKPCPCGYQGDARCRCSPDQIDRYQRRISGPLLDRIDLHVPVPRVPPTELRAMRGGEASSEVRERVIEARQRQQDRQQCANAALDPTGVATHCALSDREATLLEQATERLKLSARAYHRVLKLARTIADLQCAPNIQAAHLTEAIQYRRLDRQ